MTSHGKTYTNAFPSNSLKHWQSIGYPLGTHWVPVVSPLQVLEKALEVLGNPLEVLRKAVEKLCAEPLKNPLGKFTQAIVGVESKQSFIRLS